MKKLSIILNLIFITILNNAQWQADVRLTNSPADSYTSYNNAWCTASSGNYVHVVWHDNRDGNYEIYYKRSSDGGNNWGTDIRLTNSLSNSEFPSIAVSGQFIHVVWYDQRDGNREIYYKRSTDGGGSWETDNRLTNNSAFSMNPSLSISGSVVHLVWHDNRDGNYEIYYKRSTDGGSVWGTDTRLTNSLLNSGYASVSVSGSVVHVVWQDERDSNIEIYYKRSTDGGSVWGTDTRLTNNSANSEKPCVSVSSQAVHVVWYDNRDGNPEIYYKRSTDGGSVWGADIRLTSNSAASGFPSGSVSGSSVHVVWYDNRNGNWEVYYKHSADAGLSWGTDTRLTNNTANSWYPSISVSGSTVHVVWQDGRDGNDEIYYKRNPTGNPNKIIQISSEVPESYILEQNFPNPFNPSTVISFQLPARTAGGEVNSFTKLVVYDILGREISTLVNDQLQPGTYEVEWDGSNLSSGIYYYSLHTGNYIETKKMVLIK